MAGSIHVEVRKAVIDGIANALVPYDPDQAISVTYGWQGSSDTAAREQVFTSNARADHGPGPLKAGRAFRDESMNFDITVMVAKPGEPPDEAETRAMEIGQVIEEFIADHKGNELAIEGLKWIRVSEFASDYRIGQDGGSLAIATYTVTYSARLT